MTGLHLINIFTNIINIKNIINININIINIFTSVKTYDRPASLDAVAHPTPT